MNLSSVNFIKWSSVLLAILVLSSCTRKKDTQTSTTHITRPVTMKTLMNKWTYQATDYDHMHSSVRLSVAADGQRYRASAKMIHHRGEVIYMSIKKLGFELGEAWITRDSFHMINRLLNEYISEPLEALERAYHVKADFELLEEIATGVPPLDQLNKKQKTKYVHDMHQIVTTRPPNLETTVRFTPAMTLFGAKYDESSDRYIALTYRDADDAIIGRKINVFDDENGALETELTYLRVAFEQEDVPTFTPPKNFAKSTF